MSAGGRLTMAALVLGCALGRAPSARAYSDPSRFGESVAEGGGGGRWFTGSVADGFSCVVCHEPRSTVAVTVELPARYVPLATYEVRVSWTDAAEEVSALVEFSDGAGRPAGTLIAPAGGVLGEEESCEPYNLGIPALQVLEAPGGRQIMGMADCGARQLRFQWTAPAGDVGPVYLNGGVVWSDDNGDLAGDAVTLLAHEVLSPSGAKTKPLETTGCAAVPGAPRTALPLLLVLAAGALIGRRLRARA